MKVVCLEGCHGAGKTSILARLRRNGRDVLEEDFLTQKDLPLGSVMGQQRWAAKWFERVLAGNPNKTYFVDRSPLSAGIYSSQNREEIMTLALAQMKELESFGVDISFVFVEAPTEDDLWMRISARLVSEPERATLSEGDPAWMRTILARYKELKVRIQHTVLVNENAQKSCERLMNDFLIS